MSFVYFARALFVVLLLVVTYLTLTPRPEDFKAGFELTKWLARRFFGDVVYTDKIQHFLSYGALGAAAALARIRLAGRGSFVALALALYGGALEGAQSFVATRQTDFFDALANGAGAGTGYVVAAALLALTRTARA